MFKNGLLPGSGGWLIQANKYVQVMAFIDSEMNKHKQNTVGKDGKQ